MKKIKYDGKIHEVKDIVMVSDENNPGEYVYQVVFADSPEIEYLPLDEVEIIS